MNNIQIIKNRLKDLKQLSNNLKAYSTANTPNDIQTNLNIVQIVMNLTKSVNDNVQLGKQQLIGRSGKLTEDVRTYGPGQFNLTSQNQSSRLQESNHSKQKAQNSPYKQQQRMKTQNFHIRLQQKQQQQTLQHKIDALKQRFNLPARTSRRQQVGQARDEPNSINKANRDQQEKNIQNEVVLQKGGMLTNGASKVQDEDNSRLQQAQIYRQLLNKLTKMSNNPNQLSAFQPLQSIQLQTQLQSPFCTPLASSHNLPPKNYPTFLTKIYAQDSQVSKMQFTVQEVHLQKNFIVLIRPEGFGTTSYRGQGSTQDIRSPNNDIMQYLGYSQRQNHVQNHYNMYRSYRNSAMLNKTTLYLSDIKKVTYYSQNTIMITFDQNLEQNERRANNQHRQSHHSHQLNQIKTKINKDQHQQHLSHKKYLYIKFKNYQQQHQFDYQLFQNWNFVRALGRLYMFEGQFTALGEQELKGVAKAVEKEREHIKEPEKGKAQVKSIQSDRGSKTMKQLEPTRVDNILNNIDQHRNSGKNNSNKILQPKKQPFSQTKLAQPLSQLIQPMLLHLHTLQLQLQRHPSSTVVPHPKTHPHSPYFKSHQQMQQKLDKKVKAILEKLQSRARMIGFSELEREVFQGFVWMWQLCCFAGRLVEAVWDGFGSLGIGLVDLQDLLHQHTFNVKQVNKQNDKPNKQIQTKQTINSKQIQVKQTSKNIDLLKIPAKIPQKPQFQAQQKIQSLPVSQPQIQPLLPQLQKQPQLQTQTPLVSQLKPPIIPKHSLGATFSLSLSQSQSLSQPLSQPLSQSLYQSQQLSGLQQALQSLKNGLYLTKYAEGAFSPHLKHVYLSRNQKELCWMDKDNKDQKNYKSVLVDDIVDVCVGEVGPGITKHVGKAAAKNLKEFMVIKLKMRKNGYDGKKRDQLQFGIKNQELLDKFAKTLKLVITSIQQEKKIKF